ncbi:putative UDP-glucuronosyltransferase ugt-46 [Oppia nitens]|uniref:putative UDP-glucuronosyltransferase ugt-46 n=1 Tax=Oppia nitens TaxID=1686743 RepID=UPI0023DC9542|nr:putative UDP-glucuronosyltransferase ugt-46 [Oppia nitens]
MNSNELQLFDKLLFPKSNHLNIYDFPLELDYHDIRPLNDNYYRFDNFMRKDISSEPFELPVQLKDKPGKVIYFSMGSMGAVDVNNMKRFIVILEKSKNLFIVSKGPLGDKYDLSDNMWGQPSVPQTQVLPLVDLVITHGGNNTITECFYFGKPMIVMPLFFDQYDNAQRVHEKGFGIRLDAYMCSGVELLLAIETLLANKSLTTKLQKISQRIQTENSLTKLPQLLESFVENNRFKQNPKTDFSCQLL